MKSLFLCVNAVAIQKMNLVQLYAELHNHSCVLAHFKYMLQEETKILKLLKLIADYTIKYHFPHIENMSKSDSLSFSSGLENDSIVDLSSKKYAGKH